MTLCWSEKPIFCFTSDVDWASEEVLQSSYEDLAGDDLRITYFNTHPSKFISRLTNNGLIRQLIHPNFLPNSSHGNTYQEVMDYCQRLVPDADGFRTHRYFEVNDILDDYAKRGYKFFSNHCLRCEENITPAYHRSGLVSIPIFFEDGGYLLQDPNLGMDILERRLNSPGLKVINIHPAHMVFNTPDFNYTRQIKNSFTREQWNNLDSKQVRRLSFSGFGIKNVVQKLIENIYKNSYEIKTLHEIFEEFTSERTH